MGISSFSFLERDCASCWSQGTPGSSARSACGGEGEDGALPQVEVSHQRSREGTSLDRYSRQPSLSREKLLEIGARVVASTLGVGVGSGGASRVAGGLLAGVPVAVGGWGVGLGQCVQSAEAFGGPSRPLNRCLVIAINAREFCRRLEADLAAGRNTQECRGMVKSVLRGLSLPESLKDAVLYLPGGKRQAATDAGQSAVEYLATVVEFDAWDKLDKDWTSNVALRNMTPDNVMFVRMALDASGSSLDVFLKQFDKADVDSAREVYREETGGEMTGAREAQKTLHCWVTGAAAG
eukprot:jgi/Undpi1/10883/HiC_scaffold_3.g01409.m1